ncbi:hypothetical protein CPter291_2469 [Collimonas pratensis]|uniref:Uncharacterized protein n=1 Tax=Collimonas pratensis TaxID=279113 RepID=A0ABN4MAQ0_9BURK|nr:hypothetical protein CPter291_2469 [Collimonas pratensis]
MKEINFIGNFLCFFTGKLPMQAWPHCIYCAYGARIKIAPPDSFAAIHNFV